MSVTGLMLMSLTAGSVVAGQTQKQPSLGPAIREVIGAPATARAGIPANVITGGPNSSVVVDYTGANHAGDPGDPDNTTLVASMDPNGLMTEFDWDINAQPVNALSWAQEVRANMRNNDSSCSFVVGFCTGQTFPGGIDCAGTAVLADAPVCAGAMDLGASGELTIEFVDTYDDGAGPDSTSTGTLKFRGTNLPVELQEFSVD